MLCNQTTAAGAEARHCDEAASLSCEARWIPIHNLHSLELVTRSLLESREGKNGMWRGTPSKRGTHTPRTSWSPPSNTGRSDSGAKRVARTIILVCPPQKCNQRAEALPCASHNARRVCYSDARAFNGCNGANSLSSEARWIPVHNLHSLELVTRSFVESREGKNGMWSGTG